MKNLYQNSIETISFTRKQCGFFLGVAVDVFIKSIRQRTSNRHQNSKLPISNKSKENVGGKHDNVL